MLMQDVVTSNVWTCPHRKFAHKFCGICSKVAILRLRRVMTMQKLIHFRERICEIERGLVIS